MLSREYEVFTILQHWKPCHDLLPPEALLDPREPLFPLFLFLYNRAKQTYARLPLRANGENPFLHPLNVVLNFKKARLTDPLTACVGLAHDLIEEEVDLIQSQQQIPDTLEGKEQLDKGEEQITAHLSHELLQSCQSQGLPMSVHDHILAALKLLTRHKRHYYYSSISEIFNCQDPELKERVIQVKLADRIHNVLTIEKFDDEGRIYQCFKNLFILNNVKQHLLDTFGRTPVLHEQFSPTEKLFNKCCKATYEAFLSLCHLCGAKGLQDVRPLLQLAFKKFAWETAGLWEVTDVQNAEAHPLRLFQGVVRKYDARLHQEWASYQAAVEQEKAYCRKFFFDYHFTDEQITAIIDYKDAYSLKEVVAKLLYDPRYVLSRFRYSELSPQGRIPVPGRIQ